jgi:hypothetical protein
LIIQKKAEICSIIAILFFIICLILISWSMPGRQDSMAYTISYQNTGGNPSQVLPTFGRQEDEKNYYLSYGWSDFNGRFHDLSFPLSKTLLSEAEKEFGYFPADLRKHLDDSRERSKERMIANLREFVEELIQKSEYPEHIHIENVTAKSFNIKLSVPPSLHKKVKKVFDKIKNKLAKEQGKHLKRIEKEQEEERKRFLESRGIRVYNGKIGVNHRMCASRNKDRIRPIFEIVHKRYASFSLRQFMGLMLAFIQDIRYYIPPVQERGKTILSFWVPPRVLVDNFGDCDSKGVTFASFWANFQKFPILLVTVPSHFLVGLAIPSFTGEGLVVKGVRYTLCEVTGPGKMPPGMISRYSQTCLQNGQYVYELVY